MHSFAVYLDVTTTLVVLASLWIRRCTWRYRWEQPKSFGLAFIAIGTILKAPPISWLIDQEVHGLYLLIAHACIIGGISAIVYSAEHKLRSDKTMRRWHITRLALPIGAGIATMTTLFAVGGGHALNRYSECEVGAAMFYWLTYELAILYLFILGAHSLRCLLYDPPSRRGAGIYLVAVLLGMVGVACRVIVVTVDSAPKELQAFLINSALGANAIVLSLFAIGAAYMWTVHLRTVNKNRRGKRGTLPFAVM